VLGLLFSTTSLFTGALESSVQGVDLSWLMAALGGGVAYLVLSSAVPAWRPTPVPAMVTAQRQAGQG